jgi:hypothetical protein
LAGTHGLIIDLTDFGAHPDFVDEFDGGQEIIQEGAQGTADGGEREVFRRGVEATVANEAVE